MNKILDDAYKRVSEYDISISLVDYLYKYVLDNGLSLQCFNDYVDKLIKGRPVQYIVGDVDFYGNRILVDERVLIPRFETELLVEKTINYIKRDIHRKVDILDIGTGSGCIAIVLNKEIDSNVVACDISNDALDVAIRNNRINNTSVKYVLSDGWDNIEGKFDVIISNPPYLVKGDKEIMSIVSDNEPDVALYADNNGLEIYEKIFKDIKGYLNNRFLIALEIGYKQGEDVKAIINRYMNNVEIWIEKDYNDKDRFVFVRNM